MKKLVQFAPGLLAAGMLFVGILAGIAHLQDQRARAIAGWSQQGAR